MRITGLILSLTPSVLLANGTCQYALQNLGTGWVAFDLIVESPDQNVTFISGNTHLNSTTIHQQHFTDRPDGKSSMAPAWRRCERLPEGVPATRSNHRN